MPFHHKRSWLLALAALLCGTAMARAQDFKPTALSTPPDSPLNVMPSVSANDIQPFGPVEPGTLDGMQLFAPADLSEYGNFPRPNVGPWFQYDRIYWSTHQPKLAVFDSYMEAAWQWGNRFELGYMLDDDTGWMTSILKTNLQMNNQNLGSAGLINEERMAGIELSKVYRYPTTDHGGVWEAFYGARFFQFHDRFFDEGVSIATPGVFNNLGIDNDIFGPQIGLHWQYQRERWTIVSEVRALFGANFENALLTATEPGTTPVPTAITRDYTVEPATMGEFRLETEFQVAKSVSLRVGYTAIGGSGIGRAVDRLINGFPGGIVDGGRRESFFTNGLTFGVEFNR